MSIHAHLPRGRSVALFQITLGDRRRRAPGLLVSTDGAVRALLTPSADGEVVHAFACDRRVEPVDGLMVFRALGDAMAWFAPRLGARSSDGRELPSFRARPRAPHELGDMPSPAEAEAREAFLRCADLYCRLMRGRGDPGGPLHELLGAWSVWRKLAALRIERGRVRRAEEDEVDGDE